MTYTWLRHPLPVLVVPSVVPHVPDCLRAKSLLILWHHHGPLPQECTLCLMDPYHSLNFNEPAAKDWTGIERPAMLALGTLGCVIHWCTSYAHLQHLAASKCYNLQQLRFPAKRLSCFRPQKVLRSIARNRHVLSLPQLTQLITLPRQVAVPVVPEVVEIHWLMIKEKRNIKIVSKSWKWILRNIRTFALPHFALEWSFRVALQWPSHQCAISSCALPSPPTTAHTPALPDCTLKLTYSGDKPVGVRLHWKPTEGWGNNHVIGTGPTWCQDHSLREGAKLQGCSLCKNSRC